MSSLHPARICFQDNVKLKVTVSRSVTEIRRNYEFVKIARHSSGAYSDNGRDLKGGSSCGRFSIQIYYR
jgi:hypothetical protein